MPYAVGSVPLLLVTGAGHAAAYYPLIADITSRGVRGRGHDARWW